MKIFHVVDTFRSDPPSIPQALHALIGWSKSVNCSKANYEFWLPPPPVPPSYSSSASCSLKLLISACTISLENKLKHQIRVEGTRYWRGSIRPESQVISHWRYGKIEPRQHLGFVPQLVWICMQKEGCIFASCLTFSCYMETDIHWYCLIDMNLSSSC